MEPLIITPEFVNRIKKLNKVCNHYHLSLQSGCDTVLERMNRRYNTADFKNITKLLRENINEVSLTTDIIVGFPGETEEEFNSTYKFLEEIQFSKMHIFKYSPRIGTKAAGFPKQIDGNIKEERSNKLLQMSAKNEENFAKQYIGKQIDVLFEDDKRGHTSNYIEVIADNVLTPNNIFRLNVYAQKNGILLAKQ